MDKEKNEKAPDSEFTVFSGRVVRYEFRRSMEIG